SDRGYGFRARHLAVAPRNDGALVSIRRRAKYRLHGIGLLVRTAQFAAVSLRPVAAVVSSRNVTLTAMSGRMRGSFCRKPIRTRPVAFSRLAVGTIAIT